jgi:uracil-DNA glycosylase
MLSLTLPKGRHPSVAQALKQLCDLPRDPRKKRKHKAGPNFFQVGSSTHPICFVTEAPGTAGLKYLRMRERKAHMG